MTFPAVCSAHRGAAPGGGVAIAAPPACDGAMGGSGGDAPAVQDAQAAAGVWLSPRPRTTPKDGGRVPGRHGADVDGAVAADGGTTAAAAAAYWAALEVAGGDATSPATAVVLGVGAAATTATGGRRAAVVAAGGGAAVAATRAKAGRGGDGGGGVGGEVLFG